MALVNMNNSFYYLRRVSDNGLPAQALSLQPGKALVYRCWSGETHLLVIMSWMWGN